MKKELLFLKNHVRKYWAFHLFFAVLWMIAFFFFGGGEINWWYVRDAIPAMLYGGVVGFVLAFLVTLPYDYWAAGTFHKVKWIYYIQPLIWYPTFIVNSFVFPAWIYYVVFFPPLFAGIYFLTRMAINFSDKVQVVIFHAIGSIAWFYFLVLYYTNIRDCFFPH